MKFDQRIVCPLCKSSHAKQLLSHPLNSSSIQAHLVRYYGNAVPIEQLADNHYTLSLCLDCGFIWQLEILDDDGMNLLYETWINAERSLVKKQQEDMYSRSGYSRQCMQAAKAIGGKSYAIRALDFGSGWGNWLLMARALGFQAEGLELSPSRVHYAQALGLTLTTPADIPPETYALINAEQVFEHLADPVEVIRSCHRWLTPNGLLRIAVPDGSAVQQRIDSAQWSVTDMPTRPLEHVNVFTPATLRRLGTDNGFREFVPPIVLPAVGFRVNDIKYFIQSLGSQVLSHARLRQTTTIWLRKV